MKNTGVINGYVDTALWLAHDEKGNGCDLSDWYGFEDLDEDVQKEIRDIVDGFTEQLETSFKQPFSLSMGAWSTGSNLFLTGARHGAGFWDCGLIHPYHRIWNPYGHWNPWDECGGPYCCDKFGNRAERSTLGSILTDIAHTYKPPTIWIEHEGRMWMA